MGGEVSLVVNRVPERAWREFLGGEPGATVYHTPEWKRVLERSFGYRPYYLFAVDDAGDVRGLLPMVLVRSRLFGARLSSLPLSHKCGYVGDPAFLPMVVEAALGLYAGRVKKGTVEIREGMGEPFLESRAFSTYVLELGPTVEETWRKLHRSVKRRIKQAERAGVRVELSDDIGDLKEFYEINCRVKKTKGVPCHPLRFFRSILREMPEYSRLYVARVGGEIAGGGLMLYFGSTVIYGYGAAESRFLKHHPYHAFIWRAIEDAVREGFGYFDFGRVHSGNTGLAEFKRQWGTEEIPLTYSYYPKAPKLGGVRDKEWLKKLIGGMPMPLYRLGSDWIFGQVV